MKKSIRSQLIVVFILVIMVPVILLGTLSYNKSHSVLSDNYINSSYQIVKEVTFGVENYLNVFQTTIEQLTINPTIQAASSVGSGGSLKDTILLALRNIAESEDDILTVYIGTANKIMIDPIKEHPSDYDPSTQNWYSQAVESDQAIWTKPYLDEESGQVVVTVAQVINNRQGQFVGVVALDLTLDLLTEKVNGMQIGQNGYPILVDPSGITMTHKSPEVIGKPIPVEKVKTAFENDAEGHVEYTYNGTDKFASFATIELTDWRVLATLDKSEVSTLTMPILITTSIVGLVSVLIGLIIALIVSNRIIKPIRSLELAMGKAENGDLTTRVSAKSKDEVGRISNSFNDMLTKFSEMMHKSKSVSDQVVTSADNLAKNAEHVNFASMEINKTIDEIARGASEQVSGIDEGVIAINKLAEQIQELLDSGQMMAGEATDVARTNEKGSAVMSTLKEKNEYSNESTIRISKAISALRDKTSEIDGILETITNIASQTNLLALNASIEAARAGEHGKGFAVVAEEIRKLAEGSSEATDSIRDLINEIGDVSNQAVTIMDEVTLITTEQNDAVKSAEDVFDNISVSIEKISQLIITTTEFVVTIDTQKEEIVRTIEGISAVSEESAASSEEVTATVTEQTSSITDVNSAASALSEIARELQDEINKFTI